MPDRTAPPPPGAPPALGRVRLALTVFLPFAFGYFLSYLYRSVNAVIADDLEASLAIGAAGLGVLTSAYFVSFAAFQLPLGVLLDRYGARRVEAVLLLVAALGAVIFALAGSLATLTVGRALIGLGVSACLMAAFKNTLTWWPKQRMPLINGMILAAGGLGALAATTPVALALQIIDWRGVFLVLAAMTVAGAAFIWVAVPDRADEARAGGGLMSQIRSALGVYRNPFFWRLAPMTTALHASYGAYQGLWAGLWLRDVDGLPRLAVAEHLQMIALAMIFGYLVMGILTERLARIGIRPILVAGTFQALYIVTLALLLVPGLTSPYLGWALFGFFGTASVLNYAVLSQAFPPEMGGRANTALNLMGFTGAFAVQAGVGALIALFPPGLDGGFDPAGHRLALAVVLGLCLAAMAWFVRRGAPKETDVRARA